jgi:hypothetical protein
MKSYHPYCADPSTLFESPDRRNQRCYHAFLFVLQGSNVIDACYSNSHRPFWTFMSAKLR